MRIATYNVEWFTHLFNDDGELLADQRWSRRYNVKRHQQLDAIGAVFQSMDADAIVVVEAPDDVDDRSTVEALENFARHYKLRTRKAMIGFSNDTQQEIALLFDPDALSATHDPIGDIAGKKGDPEAPRFDSTFRWIQPNGKPATTTFSKPPLELVIKTKAGASVRLIGVHVKSKAPHGAKTKAEVRKISIDNRRKQLAQCNWLRNRVAGHLAKGETLIVAGDFNDGPGLDEYEKLFGQSGVEVVMGEGDDALFDPHARLALSSRIGAMPSTSRFFISDQKRYMQALLDYIMVSKNLMDKSPKWRIWHPFDDPYIYKDTDLREALLTASDHFPVTLDIDI